MSSLNHSYFVLGLILLTLLGSGCQKAASSGVRAKKGVFATGERSQDEAKIEKLLKEGKSADSCGKGITEKNAALQKEIETASAEAAKVDPKNSDKISDDTDKSLLAHSQQIKQLTRALIFEFVNKNIAACGKGKDLIGVESTQQKSNEAYILISEARGEDTPDSLAAKAKAKKKDESAEVVEHLLGKQLKLKKELVEVLDEQNQANFLFVTQGQIGSTKEGYETAIEDLKNGVCLLEKAPLEKLKENLVVTILKTDVVTSEALVNVTHKKITQKINLSLIVQMGSGDQLLTFNCKLKGDLKTQSAASQFFEIFGDLLKKEETSNKP